MVNKIIPLVILRLGEKMRIGKIIILIMLLTSLSFAQRLKDIAYFQGVSDEQLIGYGLVVGLAGSGDTYRSTMTHQSVISMLKRFGVNVPELNFRTRNVAAVMVTATVSNQSKKGRHFDVTVSSIGDAKSLMGGTLLLTPLSDKTGNVYATAQGAISTGGYDVGTPSGGRISRNITSSGSIPNGGIFEKDYPGSLASKDEINIVLNEPDFTTANNVSAAINSAVGQATATAEDASLIKVKVPANQKKNISAFLAQLEGLQVQKDVVAKVVLNEKTGTVVTGSNVTISPCTVTHGNLNIEIKSYPVISQPSSFSQGGTVVFNNLVPTVKQDKNNTVEIQGASNVQQVAAALNSLKVSPRDIIAIFQAIKEAGALTAELVIM